MKILIWVIYSRVINWLNNFFFAWLGDKAYAKCLLELNEKNDNEITHVMYYFGSSRA